MRVRLVSKTKIDNSYLEELMREATIGDSFDFIRNVQGLEGLVAYMARVSSSDQKNPSFAGLIKFCMSHGHWSILEMGNICFEIETSRMVSPQILRHRSFNFQEFSQRYQSVDESGIELYVARRQDKKNRQNSIDDMPDEIKEEWRQRQISNWKSSFEHYKWALDNNIAKECARAVLPLQSKTKMFMNGSLRSWVHYINLRSDTSTQKEHREIADAIKEYFKVNFKVISEAAGWI
jgi:thymidylate synthase (FAD)